MNYRQEYGQYHETGRSRRCISYTINTDDVYNRNAPSNGPSYSREHRSPENWRIRTNSVEPPRNANVDPKSMSFNRLVDAINPAFIVESLERTYNFLKGPDTEIWFPNLTLFKEEFLIRLTERNNLHCTSFNRSCKSLARDILNIMDRNRGEFEWVHDYGKNNNQRVLMYQKLYLNRSGSHEREVFKVPHEPSEKALSDVSDDYDDQQPRSGPTKKQRKFRKLIGDVSTPFIMSTLQTLIDFVDDESRQTMEFRDQPVENSRFIKCITGIVKNRNNIISILPNECYELGMRLCKDKERGVILNVREGRAGRQKLKNLTIRKNYQPKKKLLKNNAKNDSDRCSDYDPKQLFMNALSSNKEGNSNKQTNDSGSLNREQPASDRVYNTSKGIDWCREGRNSGNETSVNEERGRPRRRNKLIEALSQPIELDKAKGMMEKMGWKGGALGARGEGITEPIMPALDLKAGAGLGHTYQKPMRKRNNGFSAEQKFTIAIKPQSYKEFRCTILDEILALLRRKGMGLMMEVEVESPLDVNERSFLYDVVDGFNNREPLTSETDKEKELNCRIMANMNNNMQLELGVDISRENKLITITKTRLRAKRQSRRRRQKKSIDNNITEESDIEYTVTHNDIENLADELMDKHPNEAKRTIIALAFRITFLKNILKFVESDCSSSDISFQGKLTKKQMKFLENLIININRREKGGYSTRTENSTYSNILRNMSGVKLDILFPNARTFTLARISRKDRDSRSKRESKRLKEREDRENRRHNSRESRSERTRDRRSASPEQKHENRTDRHRRSGNKRDDRKRSETPDSRSLTPERKHENRTRTSKSERTKDEDRSCTPERKIENRTDKTAKCENQRSETPELESLTPEYTPPRSMTPEIKTPELDRKNEEVIISDDESIDLDNYGDDDDDDSYDEIDMDESNRDLNETQSTLRDVSMEDIEKEKNGKSTENLIKSAKENGEEKPERYNANIDQDILVIDTTETISSSPSAKAEKVEISTKICAEDIMKVKEDIPELSPGSSKRSRTSSEGSETQAKRVKISQDIKAITVKDINEDIVNDIVRGIAKNIDENDFLPLLKCKGIVDNDLVYITYNDLTTEWLKTYIKSLNLDIEIQDYTEKEVYKVGIQIHNYINEDIKSILNRIKRYNSRVNIDAWKVNIVKNHQDFHVYILEIDEISYRVICENGFALYAGVDKVEFSRVWS